MKKSRKKENTSRQMKIKIQIPKSTKGKKVVLRGKFIWIRAYLKKEEKSQKNNLNYHLMALEK